MFCLHVWVCTPCISDPIRGCQITWYCIDPCESPHGQVLCKSDNCPSLPSHFPCPKIYLFLFMCMWVVVEARKDVCFLGVGVTDHFDAPGVGVWMQPNLSPLPEQQVLLTTELFLQPCMRSFLLFKSKTPVCFQKRAPPSGNDLSFVHLSTYDIFMEYLPGLFLLNLFILKVAIEHSGLLMCAWALKLKEHMMIFWNFRLYFNDGLTISNWSTLLQCTLKTSTSFLKVRLFVLLNSTGVHLCLFLLPLLKSLCLVQTSTL